MNKIHLAFVLLSSQVSFAQNALLIPDTLGGTTINLDLKTGSHQFYSGKNTATMGANGSILGPTLLLNKGDLVDFRVTNNLNDTTTIHWHGLHVSSENDGGPHTSIAPKKTWSPSFTIMDKAATYWYHPHLHGHTNEHVSKGIAGLILVRDNDEAKLNLPRTYGVDDIPLVIQTKDFDANQEIVVMSNSDDVIMVNATIDAFIELPAQVIRYRVLNGSSQRAFNIGLSNNKAFYQIASDGGLLSKPIQTTRVLLAPGERAELLIDFSGMNGQTVYLKSYASQIPSGIYGASTPGMSSMMVLNGYSPNPLNGTDFNILKMDIVAQNSNPVTTIPTNLVTVTPLKEADSKITRKLNFSPVTMGRNQLNGKFTINNVSFKMKVINERIPINNTEIWELSNTSGISHPFHIHDVQFYILTRNGVAPPVNEQGRKDVVLVKPRETVRFIAKFEDFANEEIPYMYHCHLLTHEDDGMMGQFVVHYPLSLTEETIDNSITIYPNPSNGYVFIISTEILDVKNLVIHDQMGREIEGLEIKESQNGLAISNLNSGLYYVSIITNKQSITKIISVY